jgi:hypothetical protein
VEASVAKIDELKCTNDQRRMRMMSGRHSWCFSSWSSRLAFEVNVNATEMSWKEEKMAALNTWKGPQDIWPGTARLAFARKSGWE